MSLLKRFRAISTLCLVLFILFFAFSAFAGEVRVGIGFSIPPYVIKDQDGGVEVDAIREAFKAAGHDAVFVYLPNLRLPVAFREGSVDCVATNSAYDISKDSGIAAFYSDTTVVFQNYAISLAKNDFNIPSIDSLSQRRVLAFNNAVKYLGSRYAAIVNSNPEYSEHADQSLQVRMLYSGRIDVVISEKRIFLYWRKKLHGSYLSDSIDLTQNVDFSPIFPPAPRHLAFKDRNMRNQFNMGLDTIRENGVFATILSKYIGVELSD